jgi:hypothetical protein
MEREFRALQPEMEQVVTEAVDIAFTALTEVARGLSADPGQTVAELQASHRRVRAKMAASPLALFNDDAMAGIVEPIMREHMPDIVGGAVRTAIKAAFSTGKEAGELQARMDRMEHELDARVDARAEALEPLAKSMCSRLRRMDALDDALEVRTADGRSLRPARGRCPQARRQQGRCRQGRDPREGMNFPPPRRSLDDRRERQPLSLTPSPGVFFARVIGRRRVRGHNSQLT